MLEWILASGLTQEELVRIQLPAPVITRPQPVRRAAPLVARANVEETRMNEAVVRHIEEVQAELRAATEKSLDAATDRYVAMHVAGGV